MAERPRLLDLFCGAGGCSVGYERAGFDVYGVDIEHHADYPFDFWAADALDVLDDMVDHGDGAIYDGVEFHAIHASPPCQAYIRSGNVAKDGRHPDLVGPVRELLNLTGLPWVIENVPGAPMRGDILLCGSMFGLEVRRHRYFETSWHHFGFNPTCDHSGPITGVYGHPHGKNGAAPGMLPSDVATWSRAMGIDWMNAADLAVAIPPAYCRYVGELLLDHLKERAA